MDELLWKIFGIILALILIFMVPIFSFYDRMDASSYNVAYDAVSEFSSASRELGLINKYNYDRFMAKLNSTGLNYDVELEHYKKVYIPVLDDAGNETGEIKGAYRAVYDGDLTKNIYDEDYLMEAGDMLYIRVYNKSHSTGEIIRSRIFGTSLSQGTIYVRGGGMVHSDGID